MPHKGAGLRNHGDSVLECFEHSELSKYRPIPPFPGEALYLAIFVKEVPARANDFVTILSAGFQICKSVQRFLAKSC